MPKYVERNGDWVLRPPGGLNRVQMHVFLLPAAKENLRTLARRFIDRPSGGVVTTSIPLPFVIMMCAEIRYGYSENQTDRSRGFGTERDVGFFVPTILTYGGKTQFTNLIPYLFVDNFPAVLIGREIYGFPKVLGNMTFINEPHHFEVMSVVSEKGDPMRCIVDRPIVTVCSSQSTSSTAIRRGDPTAQVGAMIRKALRTFRISTSGTSGTAGLPMSFLKQFRDSELPGEACHQSIVSATAQIVKLRQARLVNNAFQVYLPPYSSLKIAQTLGLGRSPIKPKITFFTDLDFRLPYGKVIWS